MDEIDEDLFSSTSALPNTTVTENNNEDSTTIQYSPIRNTTTTATSNQATVVVTDNDSGGGGGGGGGSSSRPHSENLKPLTGRQLGLLVRLTPSFMYWLRDLGVQGGSLIISGTAAQDLLYILLHKMLDVVNFSGDLTMNQIRELGDEFGEDTMAAAVRKIVTEAEPQLVPPMVGFALIKSTSELPDMMSPDPVTWGGLLDCLTRTNYFVLAELCAILRDTNMVIDASGLVGPSIIARNVDFHGKFDETTIIQLSTKTMKMLIVHCELLFGRCGAPPSNSNTSRSGDVWGLGKRSAVTMNNNPLPAITEDHDKPISSSNSNNNNNNSNNNNNTGDLDQELTIFQTTGASDRAMGRASHVNKKDPRRQSSLPIASKEDAVLVSKKNALKAFYQWRDESRVTSVDDLFANHTFASIAKGVFTRYSILPPGWRMELDELAKKDPESFTWYLPSDSIQKSITTANNNNNTNTSTTQRELSSITNVIDEILDSELTFYETLHEVQQKYVSRIRSIAMGKEGAIATSALGINAGDVENVFGWRLAQVIQTSSLLLSKLEVVNLVRTETLNPGGRAVHVAKAFDDIAQELSINYAPFVSGHQNSMQLLKRGEERQKALGDKDKTKKVSSVRMTFRISSRLTRQSSQEGGTIVNGTNNDGNSLSPLGANGGNGLIGLDGSPVLDFLGLWRDISGTSPRLRGQSLQSMMILPIQRVPRYKLLLQELDKRINKEHPAKSHLNTALAQISQVASEINEALRRHQKLVALVGEQEMPQIAGATISNKSGKARLTVSYSSMVRGGGGGAGS
jgi:hypothetical protein